MEFGAELDDDLFETSRNRENKTSVEYTPKVYDVEWFVQSGYSETEEEHLAQLKSYADHLYYSHKYSDSAKKYMECLETLQSSNITLRRDCLEGISRSCMHQEQHPQALLYALKLFGIACNVNHKVVAWSVLASIYHQMGRFSDELDALHHCLQHHSWNYDFWLRLAFCYSGFFGIELNREIQHKLLHSSDNHSKRKQSTSKDTKIVLDERTEEVVSKSGSNGELNRELCSTHDENILSKLCESRLLEHNSSECQKNVHMTSSSHDDTESSCWQDSTHPVEEMSLVQRGIMIICACLVRARLLLQTCILGYHSFAHESNIWQQEQIASLINSLDVEESIVEHCTQVYLRDIGNEVVDCVEDGSVLEKLKEKSTAEEESNENVARKQFEAKWFGWLFTK